MILGRKKATLKTANDLYESMTKYSRVKSNFYKTVSPLDIKSVDEKVLKALMQYPEIATCICPNDVPFILFCVECNFVESVKWFLNHSPKKDIKDKQNRKNIAIYAYELDLKEILDYCIEKCPQLLQEPDINGITVFTRMENDKKIKELTNKKG